MLDERVAELEDSNYQPPTVRERDLPGHLKGENETAESTNTATAIAVQPLPEELKDPGVREALNLLKGLAVFAPRKPAAK
jgi:hypothetical protein